MSARPVPADLLAKSGEAVKSGPIGLAIILILCIACYFLFKSMSRHLKTVREEFPTDAPADATSPADGTAPVDGVAPAAPAESSAQPVRSAQPVEPAPPPSSE